LAILVTIILVASHSDTTCQYAVYGGTFAPCNPPHLVLCQAPAYFAKQIFTEGNVAYERELHCGWGQEVPTMAYISLILSIPALIGFGLVVRGLLPKYLPFAFGAGLLSMVLLGITGLLMWDDMRLGSRLYADPSTGSWFSHNTYYFTFGLVVFLFISMTVLTTQSYRVISQENKKEAFLGEEEAGIQMPV